MAAPYTDAELVAAATGQHAIEPRRANADGHDPCSCGQWWGSPEGPSWDEHMAEVALAALSAAGRLAPVDDDPRHIIELRADGWTMQHPLACRLSGNLFDCPVNRAVEQQATAEPATGLGRYACWLHEDDGQMMLGDRVDQAKD